MQLLQSLFPALHQRQNAKRHNRLVQIADRVENTRRKHSNQSLADEASFNAWVNDTQSRKVMKTLGRNLNTLQKEYSEYATKQDAQKLATQVSDLQAMGAVYAQNAMNGVSHTTVAKQIEVAMRQQSAENLAMAKLDERSDRRRYEISVRDLVSQSMDGIPSNVVNAQLDYNYSKSEQIKVGGRWSAAIGDVSRLVATYFGGPLASQSIDIIGGRHEKLQQAWQGTQGSYDRIYGPGVKRIGSYDAPDLTGLVGMAGSMFGSGGKVGGSGKGRSVSGIHGAKIVGGRKGGFNWGNFGSFGKGGGKFGGSNGWSQGVSYGIQTFLGSI